MNVEMVCKKIFDFVLPFAENVLAPISYINLEIGFNTEIDDDELWECFNKLRWDTTLSSAELFIIRKAYSGEVDKSIKIISISIFEDDENVTPVIPVKNGLII